MALHHALTGLRHRVLLEDRIKPAIEQAARTGKRVVACFIDLPHFKHIHDAGGPKSGDAMSQAIGPMFKNGLREGDLFARWGVTNSLPCRLA